MDSGGKEIGEREMASEQREGERLERGEGEMCKGGRIV
jgi:hypothetical protein